MIFQNRAQFGGQVPRIGVLLGTSRGSHVKMGRLWKIVSLESNKSETSFVFHFCAQNATSRCVVKTQRRVLVVIETSRPLLSYQFSGQVHRLQ